MRIKGNLVSDAHKINVHNISSKKQRQPSGIQILLQYIVNKERGGVKTRELMLLAAPRCLSCIKRKCSHGFKKKHPHTQEVGTRELSREPKQDLCEL